MEKDLVDKSLKMISDYLNKTFSVSLKQDPNTRETVSDWGFYPGKYTIEFRHPDELYEYLDEEFYDEMYDCGLPEDSIPIGFFKEESDYDPMAILLISWKSCDKPVIFFIDTEWQQYQKTFSNISELDLEST